MRPGDGSPERPLFAALGADLIAGRNVIRDRYASLAESAAEHVRPLAARGRRSPPVDINVVGVGVAEKVSGGERTGTLCVQVLVAKKLPRGQVGRQHLVPSSIDGVPTDVVGVGYPHKLALENRLAQRPLRAGASISPAGAVTAPNALAGTLGVFARPRGSNRLHLISNNHVIAFENAVPPGDPVLQPGTLDGGGAASVVGSVSHVVKLKYGNRRNWMDVAAAEIAVPVDPDRVTVGIGPVRRSARARLNSVVRKSGRTTGLTEGIVRTVKLDVFNVAYDGGMVRVDDVFAVEGVSGPFSRGGDSGSGVVDAGGALVGLLFAGTDTQTFVIPIQRVLRRLRMRIA